MRVLVCGGRDCTDQESVIRALDRLSMKWPRTPPDEYGNWLPAVTILSGGARGVDAFAADWAAINWTGYEEYPADWKTHGRAAGPIRNQRMIDEGEPDLVVAFPGGHGTADMVCRARVARIKVVEVK